MRPNALHILSAGIVALAVGAPRVQAQVPGYQQLDTRQIIAEYHAEVISQLNSLMARWGRAWVSDDIEALSELYEEDAVLIPRDGVPLRGWPAIQGHFETTLPLVGAAEAFMLDFDASGGMATIYGNYRIELQTGPQAGRSIAGPVVTVYKQQGRTWRIRTQVFIDGG